MKLTNKICAALVLFGMSGAAFGYDLTILNKTMEPITVSIKKMTLEAVIQPNQTHTFSLEEADCLQRISVNGKQAIMIQDLCKTHNGVIFKKPTKLGTEQMHYYISQ